MIDHLLGRPDPGHRKYQVFTVLGLWAIYLSTGDRHGPPFLRELSKYASHRLTPWQTLVAASLVFYVMQNFGKIIPGLNSPEPLALMYTRDYFRATWFTTGLDAGFFTMMNIRPKWLRDLASIVSSIYYLFNAEKADTKVKKVLACTNIDYMRTSWEKSLNPYLSLASSVMRPRYMVKVRPRRIVIQRPPWSKYTQPVSAVLFFDGPIENLKRHDKVILDVPGGGFVAMSPMNHLEKLLEWSAKSGLPVIALDYKKAPEYPYPYALQECFDAYCEIFRTKGGCVGLAGEVDPKVVAIGDSAGGNLVTGMALLIAQNQIEAAEDRTGQHQPPAYPMPDGLVLVYPALNLNLNIFMTESQLDLMRTKRAVNKGVLDRKNEDYRRLQPNSTSRLFDSSPMETPPQQTATKTPSEASYHDLRASLKVKRPFTTSIAMTSMISYFHDRVLSPELMRAMLLLYVGEHNQPDFATDHLLSPLLAPEELLAKFPMVYMLTGERDPLSDDTVLFAGRLRQAHEQLFTHRQELGLEPADKLFNSEEHVQYSLIPGISHGFLQFVNFYPAGWKYIAQCRHWMMELFSEADKRSLEAERQAMRNKLAVPGAPEPRRASTNAIDDDEFDDDETSAIEIPAPHRSTGDLPSDIPERSKTQTSTPVYASGRRASATPNKKSLSRMTSSEDLVARRMRGLTMNIMGDNKTNKAKDRSS